jgi:hypothetical protein
MDEAGKATVSRLIEILAGRAPMSQAPQLLAPDVVSHMDGHTFSGIDTWAAWLSYVRTHSRVGPPDLETGRLVTDEDGTVTAYGRWIGRENGERVLSGEIWARYRVVDGKVVEIWTHRGNYVFLLGPSVGTSFGLLLVMLRVFLWSKTVGRPELGAEAPAPGRSGREGSGSVR